MFDAYAAIYDPGPIHPIVHFKEKMAVWTGGKWYYYSADYIEPMPRSAPLTVEMVVASATGITALAANGTIVKSVVQALRLNENEFFHLRWEPLDDVEGVLWEQSGQGRFLSRNTQARVDLQTHLHDPYLATTTFWIIGKDRDMNLEVRNPTGYAMPMARFAFWGYRYVLGPLSLPAADKGALERGDITTVRNTFGPVTFVPAEGRAS